MDSDYLKEHLVEYISLICGVENKPSCFCEVLNENRFVFGYVDSKGRQQVNRVTRQVAIALAMQYHNYVYHFMGKNVYKDKVEKIVRIESGQIVKRTK